jgi:hypothetical protein
MASSEPLRPPTLPKDLDDLVESIFTKHKNSTSSTHTVPPDWQQWWDCIKNDGEVSFLLQSGINSIMSGAYDLAMKRVLDTASRKKQFLAQNSTAKSATGTSTNQSAVHSSSSHRFDEKVCYDNSSYHSERARDKHRHKFDNLSGLKEVHPFQRNGHHGNLEKYDEQRDSVSRERSLSVELSHRNDYHEDRNRSNITPFRTNAARNDNNESGSYFERRHDKRDVRRDAENISAYNRHLDVSNRLTDGHSRGDDRSYQGDHVSRRQDGPVDRYSDHNYSRYEHHGRSNYEKNRFDCDNRCYDHPRHRGSSQTSSQLKSYNHDNASLHRSSWSTSRSNRLAPRDSRDSWMDWRNDKPNDHEPRKREHRSYQTRSVDRADRSMDLTSNDYRYEEKSDYMHPVAAIPLVAIVKNDFVDQKSMKTNGRRESNNHSSPRSRKSRKSKRHRRSSNHDSNGSISGSTISSRGSSRRHHRRSSSGHKRRHILQVESDEESLSSSTHRRSRHKRKSTRHRQKRSDSEGITDNRKSDSGRDVESQKEVSKSNISFKKRKDQDKDR